MTKQESFKRRVRARMAKTGERYAAARKMLIDEAEARAAASNRIRRWCSEPEVGDDAVVNATDHSWDDWVTIIETDGPVGDPPSMNDHPAVARWLSEAHGLDSWWAQCVTGGYERITGVRLPYQRADGTFTAGKSATIAMDAHELRALLLDADGRSDLFPGHATELVSKPTAKAIRIAIGGGVAQFGLIDRGGGRAKVTVAHEKLPGYDDVEAWRHWWADWLEAIDPEAAV